MLIDMPNELIPYVWFSKKNGLVCAEDMPESLRPLYLEMKRQYEAQEQARLDSLNKLIVDEGAKQE